MRTLATILAIAVIVAMKLASPVSRARAEIRAADMARDVTDTVRALRKVARKRPPFMVPRSGSPRK